MHVKESLMLAQLCSVPETHGKDNFGILNCQRDGEFSKSGNFQIMKKWSIVRAQIRPLSVASEIRLGLTLL